MYLEQMKNIARIRKLKGWNQVDLANECGINQATISKAEKGDGGVSLVKYQAIADALETPLHVLFAPDMTDTELRLLSIFRSLPLERQQGWIDILNGPVEYPQRQDQ